MIQQTFLQEDLSNKEKKYATGIEAPIYDPKNRKPHIVEFYDVTKSNRLIAEINKSNLPEDEKKFLIEAAKRHTVFNYEKIADYYAHSDKEMQSLMERSALVIIDFHQAIENGFIKLCEDIRKQYLEENGGIKNDE